MRSISWAVVGLVSLAVGAGITGKAADKPNDDESAIRQAVDAYVEAYENSDAKALAALWGPDSEYLSSSSGKRLKGRDAIEQEFARIFAAGPAKLEVTVHSIRLLTPDVATEEGEARVTAPGAAPEESTYLAIHVKRDGKWLLDSLRETELPSRSTAYEHLQELEWLVGTWVDADDEATVETTCQWARNKNFLTRNFKVQAGDHTDMEGTQVIGWDAGSGQIRSWVFDSDGGFSQGIWKRQGDRWIINSLGTLPDGGQATSMNILTKIDDDTLTWQTTGREVDGEILPNVEPVTVKRVSEDE